ncbi:MAG: redoxin domain-containing protein [Pseudohongiella sp.]|uniref:redoxin domain-containing protein n=1 Tax=Pseudohongiella sp. TaxID=1979412 RepID=UPI0034A03DEB
MISTNPNRWLRGILFCVISIWLAVSTAHADERVTNFTLIDQHGEAMELHYHGDASAVVLLAHRNNSPLVAESARALAALKDDFSDVRIFLINAVTEEGRDAVRADMQALGLDLPVLDDRAQLVTRALGLTHAGQALVVDTKRWQVLYRGPVTGQPGDSTNPVADVLTQFAAGETNTVASLDMPATYNSEKLDLPDAAAREAYKNISYSNTVAPILMQKCVDCHRPGGIGPWAMTGHAMVQGFSPMIRETILTKRMPPWHADPETGSFAHDISLSIDEQQTIVNWIDAGAPRGDGPDPLHEVTAIESAWALGEPDLIIDLPNFMVPATGVLDYENFAVPNPLKESKWVRAVQIIPGDRQAVHHVIATVGPYSPDNNADDGDALTDPQLMTFVPGNEVYEYPQGTGLYVPADSSVYAQMHYTTYGRESADATRIGLYFADEAPEHVLQHYAIINPQLQIPAGAREHEETAYYQLQRDAVVYALFPHAHYRGKASRFSFRYPDGSEELVLNSPNYDFNWQRYFKFEEPKNVPAGTMIIHRTVYDNSANNLSNPDPERDVSWGEQTSEEMLYGGISYRYTERKESDFKSDPDVDPEAHFMTSLALGFMDTNLDGKVSLSEMPEGMRPQLAETFTMLDYDNSGGLEYDQLSVLMTQTPVGEALLDAL